MNFIANVFLKKNNIFPFFKHYKNILIYIYISRIYIYVLCVFIYMYSFRGLHHYLPRTTYHLPSPVPPVLPCTTCPPLHHLSSPAPPVLPAPRALSWRRRLHDSAITGSKRLNHCLPHSRRARSLWWSPHLLFLSCWCVC